MSPDRRYSIATADSTSSWGDLDLGSTGPGISAPGIEWADADEVLVLDGDDSSSDEDDNAPPVCQADGVLDATPQERQGGGSGRGSRRPVRKAPPGWMRS